MLAALGVETGLARASLRFGLGRTTSEADVEAAADLVVREVRALRKPPR